MLNLTEEPLRDTVLYEVEPLWQMGRFEYALYCLSSYNRRLVTDTLLVKKRPDNMFR